MKNIPLLFLSMIFLLAACQQKQKPNLSPEETAQYLSEGKVIVQESFKALSSQLAAAMNEGGVQNAVSYCNLRANPITDSLSKAHNVIISRITLRPRNIENEAVNNDADVLADYMKVMDSGEPMEPFIQSVTRDSITYYAPITIISPLCLKCHGDLGQDIAPADYELIRSLYPEDKATGYRMNDLRGAWKIEFKKNSE